VLKRPSDNFSVRKSPRRNGRPSRSTHSSPSSTKSEPRDSLKHHHQRLRKRRERKLEAQTKAEDSGDDALIAEPDMLWDDQDQNSSAAFDGSQTPSTISPDNNSKQENESPRKDSDQENQAPTPPIQQARGNVNDWISPSPPHGYDRNIYQGSPVRTPDTPIPVKGKTSRTSAGGRLPALPPAGAQVGPSEQSRANLNASPAGPPTDDGPESQLSTLDRWIAMEVASNDPDMRNAYHLYRELHSTQNANTITHLYEMLRAIFEVAHFNNTIFERNSTFGPEAQAPVRRGVPSWVDPPSTPEAQTDRFLPGWWDDRFEGTRDGINRPAATWAEPPAEDGEFQIHQSSKSSSSKSTSGDDGGLGRDSHWSPISPPPMRDANGNIIPWGDMEDRENRDPLGDLTPDSPLTGASNRAWGFRPHETTGLPEREFSIYVNPDNRLRRGPFDLGEPLLVQDPLNPGLLTPNPRFDPAILALISGGGRDDHGVIEIRVPPEWRINVIPSATRGRREGAPSPANGSSSSSDRGPPGDQRMVIHGPGFVIHEDSPSESSSVRDRLNAPSTLGLMAPPLQDHREVVPTLENGEARFSSTALYSDQGSISSSNKSAGNGSKQSQGGESKKSKGSSGSSKNSPSGSHSNSSSAAQSERSTIPAGDGGSDKSRSNSNSGFSHSGSKSGCHPKTPSPLREKAAADPPKARTPTESPKAENEVPWYLRWESSTVVRLREELLRRGITLLGLGLKQHMIDRLKRDDEENGVGGVYHPDEEEEEGDDEMVDEDEDEEDDGIVCGYKLDKKGSGKKDVSGNKGRKGKKGGEGNDKHAPAQAQIQVRIMQRRRRNPFTYDVNEAAERAIKRQVRGV
jgi:hypothetical protein